MDDDKEVFAWVIEASEVSAPLYWDGGDWSRNHLRAVRFSRQIDAQRIMIRIDPSMRRDDMRAAEHGWLPAPPLDLTGERT